MRWHLEQILVLLLSVLAGPTTAQSSSTPSPPGPSLNQVVSLWLPQQATTDVLASIIYYNASLTAYALSCPSTTLSKSSTKTTTTAPTAYSTFSRSCATTTITQGRSTLIYTITLTDDESTPETRTTIISAKAALSSSPTDSSPTPSTKTITHRAPHVLATINCVLQGDPTATSAICTSRSAIRNLGIQASTFAVPSEQMAFFAVTVTATASPGATMQPTTTKAPGDDGNEPYDGTTPAPRTSSDSGAAPAAQCTAGLVGRWALWGFGLGAAGVLGVLA